MLDRPAGQRSPLQISRGSRPRLSNTLLCDGQKGQVGGHNNNGGQKGANGQAETAQEDHPEGFGIHPGDAVDRQCC